MKAGFFKTRLSKRFCADYFSTETFGATAEWWKARPDEAKRRQVTPSNEANSYEF